MKRRCSAKPFDNCEPQPGRIYVSGFIAAEGSLEDVMQDIGWDSSPIIFDANGQTPDSCFADN
jgi:hypothetical protein